MTVITANLVVAALAVGGLGVGAGASSLVLIRRTRGRRQPVDRVADALHLVAVQQHDRDRVVASWPACPS
jgi:hypothetical protein